MPNLPPIKRKIINLGKKFFSFLTTFVQILSYMVLIGAYGILSIVSKLANKWSVFSKLEAKLLKMINVLAKPHPGTISRIELIDLALQSMKSKKSRTFITIGGMTIGIAAIVFLVSIGYGLQSLVIKRVARLEEMRQTDVTTQPGRKLVINQDVINVFKDFDHVELVLPQIAVVGKVNFNNSSTDMAVYGVTRDYLEQSAISPVIGESFESNQTESAVTVEEKESITEVQSNEEIETAAAGDKIGTVNFTVNDGAWIEVREYANLNSKIIGYVSSDIGQNVAEEIWGGNYQDGEGNGVAGRTAVGGTLGKWVKARVPIWKETDNGYVEVTDSSGQQTVVAGYMPEIRLSISKDTTEIEEEDSTASDWVELEGESDTAEKLNVSRVSLSSSIKDLHAVVNRGFLQVLDIKESEAVGQKFQVSFIATGKLLGEEQDRIESTLTEYTIIGVTPDERTPLFYVPLSHLSSLGLNNYSQAKVVVDKESNLSGVREQIESQGFTTSSVSDTVSQINSLFATARMLLALVGMVALSVAALGMFNTLTVSLLERTREVGLLKAMGMKSHEVRDLFLAESMVMGTMGGILGLILGLLTGKLLELGLTIFSVVKGAGSLSIIDIPLPFALLIVVLSFLVGVATGVYPARRATKISALNALRYE
jgi:ABC-type antimicrobial peptide transport system permease subunit